MEYFEGWQAPPMLENDWLVSLSDNQSIATVGQDIHLDNLCLPFLGSESNYFPPIRICPNYDAPAVCQSTIFNVIPGNSFSLKPTQA